MQVTGQTDAEMDFEHQEFSHVVPLQFEGMRLDRFLALKMPDHSRSLVSASIRSGSILLNGQHAKSSQRLRQNDLIDGRLDSLQPVDIPVEKIDFTVLFEDESLLLLSKPPGVVVHPGSGNFSGTLVSGLLHHCQGISEVGESSRPGIVHRLDKDTSGIMVIAKSAPAHRILVDMFKRRALIKHYLALVCGVPAEKKGRLVTSIGRHPINRQKMAVSAGGGRHAATNWQVMEHSDRGLALLKVAIETGRTHQIRVHMAHLGHPVAGDTVYGKSLPDLAFPRQMLHAWRLSFAHPLSGRQIDQQAPLWPDMAEVLEQHGFSSTLEKP